MSSGKNHRVSISGVNVDGGPGTVTTAGSSSAASHSPGSSSQGGGGGGGGLRSQLQKSLSASSASSSSSSSRNLLANLSGGGGGGGGGSGSGGHAQPAAGSAVGGVVSLPFPGPSSGVGGGTTGGGATGGGVAGTSGGGGTAGGGSGGSGSSYDPTVHLSALTDDRSSYPSVARACLHLNQHAGFGSDASTSFDAEGGFGGDPLGDAGDVGDSGLVSSSALFRDSSYASTASKTIAALSECLSSHADRRCRVLAAKTLGLFGRAAYGRIRHSALLFATREGRSLHRIEDEVGTDVPVALCNAALEDVDEGVSACATEALGTLTLSLPSSGGTDDDWDDDELSREILSIASLRPSRRSPCFDRTLSDEDHSVPFRELQARIYENVVPPRIRRLCHRVSLYRSPTHKMRAIPFVTGYMVHASRVARSMTTNLDRSTFAKRWYELESSTLVDEFVRGTLLRTMVDAVESGPAHAAALAALRLVHARPHAPWRSEACRASAAALSDVASGTEVLEIKCATLAARLVALRPVPIAERIDELVRVADDVRRLPCTVPAPRGTVSPSLVFRGAAAAVGPGARSRRPARIGLWTELALSVLLDGPDPASPSDRSRAMQALLRSPAVSASLSSRTGKKRKKKRRGSGGSEFSESVSATSAGASGGAFAGDQFPPEDFVGSHVAEEIVLAFCGTAFVVGEAVLAASAATRGGGNGKRSSSSSHQQQQQQQAAGNQKSAVPRDVEEWLRSALAVLSAFSSCVNWRSRAPSFLSDDGGTARQPPPPSSQQKSDEEDVQTGHTPCAAARASYARLLQQCLDAVGLLSPESSVALRLVPSAGPAGAVLPSDASCPSTTALATLSMAEQREFAHDELSTLADQLVEYKLREGVPSRRLRIALLALVSDHWVQRCVLSTASAAEKLKGRMAGTAAAGTINMNEMGAREILSTMATEIGSLVDRAGMDRSSPFSSSSASSRGDGPASAEGATGQRRSVGMSYLLVCIACVENIALTAYEWGLRLEKSLDSNVALDRNDQDEMERVEALREQIEEDSNYIVSVSLSVLNVRSNIQGGGGGDDSFDAEGNGTGAEPGTPSAHRDPNIEGDDERELMVAECLAAAGRIQSFIDGGGAQRSHYGAPWDKDGPAAGKADGPPFSVLIARAAALADAATEPVAGGQPRQRGGGGLVRGGSLRASPGSGNREDPSSPLSDLAFALSPLVSPSHTWESAWRGDGNSKSSADANAVGYLCQYYRQVVISRACSAVLSTPLGDAGAFAGHGPGRRRSTSGSRGDTTGADDASSAAHARPRNWLRLSPPPSPPSSDVPAVNRHLGGRKRADWIKSVTTVTGSSDPVVLTVAYAVREFVRHDGEIEHNLVVTMRMHNVTAVPIVHGLRLDLRVAQRPWDDRSGSDVNELSEKIAESLAPVIDEGRGDERGDPGATYLAPPVNADRIVTSATALYKREVAPGDHLTWEVSIEEWTCASPGIELRPSVTFREIESEPSTHKWVGVPPSRRRTTGGSLTNVDEGDESGDGLADDAAEDFSAAGQDTMNGQGFGSVEVACDEEDEITDVTLSADPVALSPMIVLRPCPLVFFRDESGDEGAFRFLWHGMPTTMPTLAVVPNDDESGGRTRPPVAGPAARVLSDLASVTVRGSPSPGGRTVTRGWAFMSWGGKRVLCVLTVSPDGTGGSFDIRGNDVSLLVSLVGSTSVRMTFISDLTGGAWACGACS